MRRSIDHFVEIMSDEAKIPFFKLDIFHAENTLELYPTGKEIFGTMAKVVDSIATIAQELPSLETWVDVSSREEFITMKICEPYLEDMQARLLDNLTTLFKPVQDHLGQLAAQFQILYSDKLKTVRGVTSVLIIMLLKLNSKFHFKRPLDIF